MTEAQYSLSPHTYICPTEYHWVLLDVRRDRYLCIHRRAFDPLAPWLRETQGQASETQTGEISSAAAALAAELVEQGLLTKTSDGAHRNVRPGLCAPAATLSSTTTPLAAAACLHSPAFLFAAARADRLLRHRPFAQVVASVAERKARRKSPSADFDFSKATRLVRTFDLLRPIYPRDYLCMFDSLALIEFMALHSVFPAWIFGVTADPFQAHCWVQASNVVLNDSLERATAYNPIMSV